MITQFDRESIDEIMGGAEHHFTAHLLRLCQKADGHNLAKLRQAFPDVVALYEEWLNSPRTWSAREPGP